jgi:glutamate racemase
MVDGIDKLKKIGLFDSGIGGFSLLNQLIVDFPGFEFFYIADDEAAPYGNKSTEEVKQRAVIIVELLLKEKVDLIIVACNTATSLAIDYLRSKFDIKFVGVEPFVNALHKLKFDFIKDKIAVLTTKSMYESNRFKSLLDKYDHKQLLSPLNVPRLASIIEDLYKDGVRPDLINDLAQELVELNQGSFTHVILGCTHYPLIADYFEKIIKVKTISPCPQVSLRVGSYFDARSNLTIIDYYWRLQTSQNHWLKKDKEDIPKPIKF